MRVRIGNLSRESFLGCRIACCSAAMQPCSHFHLAATRHANNNLDDLVIGIAAITETRASSSSDHEYGVLRRSIWAE